MSTIMVGVLVSSSFALLAAATSCRPSCSEPPPDPDRVATVAPSVGGIQVNEPILERWIDAVRTSGLNTVATTVYAKQGDWDSARLWSDVELEPVRREIAAAKQAGLRVVLILRVALDHAFERNRFLWHGMIFPAGDEQLAAWFDAYSDFVLRWARLAQEAGVDVLGVGSELNRLTSTRPVDRLPALERWYLDEEGQSDFRQRVLAFDDRITAEHRAEMGGGGFRDNESFLAARSAAWRQWAETTAFASTPDPIAAVNRRRAELRRRWRALIADVRRVYDGALTYAANFDHYREVTFWDALDIIGINAYFELRPRLSTDRLAPRLEAAWRDVFDEIERFRRKRQLRQPIVFTELGYTRRRHSTVKPWAQNGFALVRDELVIWQDEPDAPNERAAALEALRQVAACERPGVLDGVLYWKLSSWPDQEAVEPFVVVLNQGDPAQRALRRFLAPGCRPAHAAPGLHERAR